MAEYNHRTQFDPQWLRESVAAAPPMLRNHGRQMHVEPSGSVLTALAWGGERPVLRVWRDRTLLAEHTLPGQPSSAPCWVGDALWLSVGGAVWRAEDLCRAPGRIEGFDGEIEDGAVAPGGETVLLLRDANGLELVVNRERTRLDPEGGRATCDWDGEGRLHVVFEKAMGIEYRCFAASALRHAQRLCEAYGSQPTVLCHGGRVLVSYLGEMCRKPSYKRWGDAWERLGHGGYVGALVCDGGEWKRFRLADSRQIVKPLRPTDTAYGGGPEVELRTRIEEFSPPALTLGPDGVPQVLWANLDRRWIYAARFLGEGFSPAIAVRGPLEQLTDCLLPKRANGNLLLCFVTKTRAYLDRIRLASRAVSGHRRIDFIQLDDLAEWRGLEVAINQMKRHAGNPVIRVGEPGSRDDGAVLADISRDGDRWKAHLHYQKKQARDPQVKAETWKWDGRAESADGIHWTKLEPVPLEQSQVIGETEQRYNIRYVEDPAERNARQRFKGLWRAPYGGPWAWLAVVSPDAKTWTKVASPTVVNADDDLRVWIDPDDVPERRFKANAISRSFCGRVAAQWTSPDGMHWNDERDTLDFKDPFGAKPDRGTTGRILLDSWAGPDDEDELHGGFVFRDGKRWLLHYMKWTADGHIYLGLASSSDGINFSRVGGGISTLPLGDCGAWDAGRVAIREAPFRVGNTWRQYYAGCSWKHGLAGIGAKTSHWASPHSPMQMGIAEIPVGHWTHLQLTRDVDQGEIRTVSWHLQEPHELTVDVEGLTRPGSSLRCEIIDPPTGRACEGFAFADCDPIRTDGQAVAVRWRGCGLSALGRRDVQIAATINGHGLRLYGMDLRKAI
jgi:hypothetical protein